MKKIQLPSFLAAIAFCSVFPVHASDVIEKGSVTPETLIKALAPASATTDEGAAATAPAVERADATPSATQSISEADAAQASAVPSRMRSFKAVRDKSRKKTFGTAPSASLMVTFETDSARLTPEAKRLIDNLGQALNSDILAKFKFVIEGHADPTGLPERNLKLSDERAHSVLQYLVGAHQVQAERLKSVGKGSTELLNQTNQTAPENRRVRILTVVE